MIIKCLAGEPLPVYGKGQNVRDWLYVDDHVRALTAVFERGQPHQSYNIGGRAERTNIDVVLRICDTLDRLKPRADGRSYAEQISFVTDRPGHDQRYAIDPSRLENDLGWRAQESFESGVEKTVRWYLKNEWWWRPKVDQGHAVERQGLEPALV
jgi:dTDP-glucose 4,6-dehydratase